jgi:hypothetical protein
MSPRTQRTVTLQNITMPVRVAHGGLPKHQRIDDLSDRIDTLKISLCVQYGSVGNVRPLTMWGAWNYGGVYQHLCLSDVRTVTGPLEALLDEGKPGYGQF